jgi:hypothetical protein
MYIDLRVKYPLFLSDFNETRIFSTGFRNILKYKISRKSIQWEPSCSMLTDTTKLRNNCFPQFCGTRIKTMGWTKTEESRWNVVPYGQNVSFYTYWFTPWSRDLEKLAGSQIVKKFPALYGIRGSLPHSQVLSPGPKLSLWMVRNTIRFYGEELLAPRQTHRPEDHPLSATRDCLFNILAVTLHIGGGSSIRNLRTRHAVVTETQLIMVYCIQKT